MTRKAAEIPPVAPRAGLVFAVSFALLLSDYMSRQVLSAVFPLLKAEWALSDARLGALGGVVALMVGLLTVPLSLVADAIGRVRSVALMAVTWSIATLACALCANYGQLLLARLALGAGEAAYGSVGLAVVFTYFPKSLRATITSAFMAGGLFGSFIGLALGGAFAAQFGWRGAFGGMGLLGLVLTVAYVAVVRERAALEPGHVSDHSLRGMSAAAVARSLVGSWRTALVYVASGLQLFVLGALTAWLPSYLNRVDGFSPKASAVAAACLLLASGVGMVACGRFSDALSVRRPHLRPWVAAAYGVATFSCLQAALAFPPGAPQAVLALAGLFFAGGTTGPAGAMIAEAAPPALHGAALAVLTLANNLLGLAPGPAVTGALADRLGLHAALQAAVCAALLAAITFGLIARDPQPTTHGR
ncbi:MAG: MFS transporter [Phenylobacterium sp.]